MRKKITLFIIALALSIIIIACNPQVQPEPNSNATIIPIYTIESEGVFSTQDCQARNLQEQYIMIESKYCGHCQEAKPIFLQAAQETGITPTILDIAEKEGREQMLSHSVEVKYTPTFIFNCHYYVGGMEKEDYITKMQG